MPLARASMSLFAQQYLGMPLNKPGSHEVVDGLDAVLDRYALKRAQRVVRRFKKKQSTKGPDKCWPQLCVFSF
jgi:thermostable 8-oxoguanine DNA glycosylase